MPAYSQRKRKIAKKSTRRSKKRLSRRIKTRRGGGGGGMTIDKFKELFKRKLVETLEVSKEPTIANAGMTAQNFINHPEKPVRTKLIEDMINAIHKNSDNQYELKQNLQKMLKDETEWDVETGQTVSVNNQIYMNFIDDFFKFIAGRRF